MIEDKKSMKSDELNIPDDYFNKRKNNEELMFEKKKHGLIRSFFFFLGLDYNIIGDCCIISSFFRSFNIYYSFISYLCASIA